MVQVVVLVKHWFGTSKGGENPVVQASILNIIQGAG